MFMSMLKQKYFENKLRRLLMKCNSKTSSLRKAMKNKYTNLNLSVGLALRKTTLKKKSLNFVLFQLFSSQYLSVKQKYR